ncbi:MAG: DUF2721 domain-containing protein [Vulcanimicrobiaceae bacterium]
MTLFPHGSGTSFLRIISAMITPAILILAAGSLVSSTLTRLARVVDRARALLDRIEAHEDVGDAKRAALLRGWLAAYLRRSGFAERALTLYYVAIGLFVAASLAITIDDLTQGEVPWLSLALVVLGATVLFAGTAMLVVETNLATGQLRSEIEAIGGQRSQADPTSLHPERPRVGEPTR